MTYRAVLALYAVTAMHAAGPAAAQQAGPEPRTVAVSEVDDLKSVFATVRSKDRIEARVRTPETEASAVSAALPPSAGKACLQRMRRRLARPQAGL